MHYFRKIKDQVDNKNFAFHVLVRGPDIYKCWNKVVTFHEPIEYARKEIDQIIMLAI